MKFELILLDQKRIFYAELFYNFLVFNYIKTSHLNIKITQNTSLGQQQSIAIEDSSTFALLLKKLSKLIMAPPFWIHCNMCGAQISKDSKHFLLSCSHIMCKYCLQPTGKFILYIKKSL